MALNSGHETVTDRHLTLTENQARCFDHNEEFRATVIARCSAMARHYRADVHAVCESDRRILFVMRQHQAGVPND